MSQFVLANAVPDISAFVYKTNQKSPYYVQLHMTCVKDSKNKFDFYAWISHGTDPSRMNLRTLVASGYDVENVATEAYGYMQKNNGDVKRKDMIREKILPHHSYMPEKRWFFTREKVLDFYYEKDQEDRLERERLIAEENAGKIDGGLGRTFI